MNLPTLFRAELNLTESAKAFQAHAKACQELAERVKEATQSRPPHLDTTALARILEPLGISLVHRDVVVRAAQAISLIEGDDRHEQDRLNDLEATLRQSLTPPPGKEL